MGGREQRVRITLWRQGSSPERGHSTIPRVEQPPHKTGWDVVPQRPQQEAGGAPTHPWRVLNGGRLPPPRGEDPSSPRASNRGCSTHSLPEWGPAPTPPPRPTPTPNTPERPHYSSVAPTCPEPRKTLCRSVQRPAWVVPPWAGPPQNLGPSVPRLLAPAVPGVNLYICGSVSSIAWGLLKDKADTLLDSLHCPRSMAAHRRDLLCG